MKFPNIKDRRDSTIADNIKGFSKRLKLIPLLKMAIISTLSGYADSISSMFVTHFGSTVDGVTAPVVVVTVLTPSSAISPFKYH